MCSTRLLDSFKFVFSQTALDSNGYLLCIMFVVVLILTSPRSRYKLIDLLNADKVTQTVKVSEKPYHSTALLASRNHSE